MKNFLKAQLRPIGSDAADLWLVAAARHGAAFIDGGRCLVELAGPYVDVEAPDGRVWTRTHYRDGYVVLLASRYGEITMKVDGRARPHGQV